MLRHGLASDFRFNAGPSSFNGCRVPVATGRYPRAAAGRHAEHPQPAPVNNAIGPVRRHQAQSKGIQRVAQGRPHANQQSLEEQDGKWNTEAARKCRSIHNVCSPHRSRHRGHRMLVIRQLLVTRTRRNDNHRGLTAAEARPCFGRSSKPSECCQCVVFRIDTDPRFKPRERLAPGRDV